MNSFPSSLNGTDAGSEPPAPTGGSPRPATPPETARRLSIRVRHALALDPGGPGARAGLEHRRRRQMAKDNEAGANVTPLVLDAAGEDAPGRRFIHLVDLLHMHHVARQEMWLQNSVDARETLDGLLRP